VVLTPETARRQDPRGMRRVVVVMPSAFTLGNLFFGFWAIVSAFQQNFTWAGWFIVFAGILDLLDGRIARLSGTSSKFGAELDSLVDVISFGVAPALLIYFMEMSTAGRFAWILCYLYVVAVALRLARYNVAAHSRAGDAPSAWFTGMPSPSAGMTLATWYPFSQTDFYKSTIAYLNLQREGLVVLMLLLAVLMVSTVRYPRMPAIGTKSLAGILGLLFHVALLIGGLTVPEHVLFPLGIAYLVFGLLRAFVLGFAEQKADALAAHALPEELDPPAVRPAKGIGRRSPDDREESAS
jgi:CDP-diacylglycerol--serine O-phosphatidyltransferase